MTETPDGARTERDVRDSAASGRPPDFTWVWRQLAAVPLRLVQFCLLAVWGFVAAGYLSAWVPLFDLCTHFRVQAAVAALAVCVSLSCWRSWPWAIGAVACLLLAGLPVVYWHIPDAWVARDSQQDARLLLTNVHAPNQDYQSVLDLVRREDPDLAVLQEVTHEWLAALAPLREDFPHALADPQSHGGGALVLSRLPLRDARVVRLGKSGRENLVANIEVRDRTVLLVASHPHPPGMTQAELRNDELAAVARFIGRADKPTILIGDLNTTMWSPAYRRLARATGLRNARKGFGVLPSWLIDHPLFAVPLDHCLASRYFQVVDCRTGADIGSDHLPLVVDLKLADPRLPVRFRR